MLLLLFACAFVEPVPSPVVLEPPEDVLAGIDRTRTRLQATDAGAELWRCIDAHGGMLRWARIGPLVATLSDGTEVGPSHPDYARLTRPFSWDDVDVTAATIEPGLVLQLGEQTATLDPTSRNLVRFEDADGAWQVERTIVYQGLVLPEVLTAPNRQLIVASWRAEHPLPGL
jgi:hypothetical protein